MVPEVPTQSRGTAGRRSVAAWSCWILLVATAAAGAGFVYKMIQFSREALTSEVASFAVVPVVVYILVALGFIALFFWALARGQFRDIEGPKYRLLESEERYDREGV